MENKIKNAFDALSMPASCEKRIEENLCKPTKEKMYYAEPVQPTKGSWIRGIAAAAALVVCVLTVGMLLLPDDTMAAADPTKETGDYSDARDEIPDKNTDALVGTEAEQAENEDPQNEYDAATGEMLGFDHYYTVDDQGRAYCRDAYVAQAHAESAPEWIRHEDGRLYFVGNGERIDITDEISLEKPFVYIYTDSNGIKWALVAGRTSSGPYVDIGNSVGWFTFRWDADMNCWSPDCGTHWSNWMNCEWPWLTAAKAALDSLPDGEAGI